MIIKYGHLFVKVIINTCGLTVGCSLNADAAPEYEYPRIIIMMYLQKMASRWRQCALRFHERFKRQQTVGKKKKKTKITQIQINNGKKHCINVHTTTDFAYVPSILEETILFFFLPLY